MTAAFCVFWISHFGRFAIPFGAILEQEGSMSKPRDNRQVELFRLALEQVIDLMTKSS